MHQDNRDYFDSKTYKVDNIKSELISLSYDLEEHGFVRKAKSLRTIVEKLEQWEHTKK
jgi:hypothetical protein